MRQVSPPQTELAEYFLDRIKNRVTAFAVLFHVKILAKALENVVEQRLVLVTQRGSVQVHISHKHVIARLEFVHVLNNVCDSFLSYNVVCRKVIHSIHCKPPFLRLPCTNR